MEDNKLEIDEARRAAQQEAVKSQVASDVNADIATNAERRAPEDQPRINQLADDFRGRAVDEVVQTEREVGVARGVARFSQVVDYFFFLIYAMLGLRFLLALMAARSTAGFVVFIRSVTDFLFAPFKGIVASPSVDGGFTLALPIVIAIIVYALIHATIYGLLRLIANRKTSI